jgi:hypothetical protein
MRGLLALVAAAVAALLLVAAASADPPPLLAIGIDGLHPTASFAIGRAVFATIAISRTPDRAPDGSFAAPLDQVALTPDEIAAGTWRDPNELEPGTYWVLLHADADIDTCFLLGDGWDASCPDGWSAQPLQLVVTTPTPRYAAAVSLARRAGIARLRLTATPLGASLPYRV